MFDPRSSALHSGAPSAIGSGPVTYGLDGEATEAVGLNPAFPVVDTVPAQSFKVVLGSWASVSAGRHDADIAAAGTADFVVDAGTMAPRSALVTSVRLVDVDVPATQQLVEPQWRRVYVSGATEMSPACRAVSLTVQAPRALSLCGFRNAGGGGGGCGNGNGSGNGSGNSNGGDTTCGDDTTTLLEQLRSMSAVAHIVALPLRLDSVRTYQKLAAPAVQLVMRQRVPTPIAALASCMRMRIVGVAGLSAAGVLLTPDNVEDTTATSFTVYSQELFDALPASPPAAGAECLPLLWAQAVDGPHQLAHVLTVAIAGLALPPRVRVEVAYSAADDTFLFRGSAPLPDMHVRIRGELAAALGFGADVTLPLAHRNVSGVLTVGTTRLGAFTAGSLGGGVLPPDAPCGIVGYPTWYRGFLALPCGNYATASALARALSACWSSSLWPPFTFHVAVPGAPGSPFAVVVRGGGRVTMHGLAQLVQRAILETDAIAALAITVTAVEVWDSACPQNRVCGAGVGVAVGAGAGVADAAASSSTCCGSPGLALRFASPAGAFALDFAAAAPTVDPRRFGYSADAATPVSAVHLPHNTGLLHVTCVASSVYCDIPRSDVQVTFDDAQCCKPLTWRSVPFQPFAAVITAVRGCTAAGGATSRYTLDAAPFAPGLRFGALVRVTSGGWAQQLALVTDVPDADSGAAVLLVLTRLDDATADFAAGTAVTVVPQDAEAFSLYFPNARSARRVMPCALQASRLGFDAQTYTACAVVCAPPAPCCQCVAAQRTPCTCASCEADDDEVGDNGVAAAAAVTSPTFYTLASPGSVNVHQDPYLLVCLGFNGGGNAPTTTGEVFYPLPAAETRLVFARVLRAACMFRPDFDRSFCYTFLGAGVNLGFIRVQILNSDGTPYATHGQPVSITLRCDVRMTAVGFGEGHVTVPTPAYAAMPLLRQSCGR